MTAYAATIVRKGRCAEDGYTEPYAAVEKPGGTSVEPMGWNRTGALFEVGTRGVAAYVATPYAGLWRFTPASLGMAGWGVPDPADASGDWLSDGYDTADDAVTAALTVLQS